VFFTATVTAAIGLLYFEYFGWIDMSVVYIHPTYITAAIVGGAVMGLGFITGGYCPGTSLCGVAIGKIDGIVYSIGLFLGILFFGEAYGWIEKIYSSGNMGNMKVTEYLNVSAHVFVLVFTIIAIVAFYVTTLIRRRVKEVYY
jgi:hypothetical protein